MPDPLDFPGLCRSGKDEMKRLIASRPAPPLPDLAGREFRGWNVAALSSVLGIRKFVKGFDGFGPSPPLTGYNSPVKQNSFSDPWIRVLDDDGNPKRYYPYAVVRGQDCSDAIYPACMVIDYRLADYGRSINPARFTVDYVVQANPGNSALLLGKSYLQIPHLPRVFLGFFVIEVIL